MRLFEKSFELHDLFILVEQNYFIKASEFLAMSLRKKSIPEEVVFFIPGLRYFYNERRDLLSPDEQKLVKETCLSDPPKLVPVKAKYTAFQIRDVENLTPYDLIGTSSSDFFEKLRYGKNIILELPEIEARFIVEYYTGDYWDPIRKEIMI